MLEANTALELIQIDHTLADVMIVDSNHRRSIGRPWLSLAIDVATRAVLGFHVGLEAPSALAVALCIEHAVLPKDRSRRSSVGETSWDMFGLPRAILVDNGPEFHGEAVLAQGAVRNLTLAEYSGCEFPLKVSPFSLKMSSYKCGLGGAPAACFPAPRCR
jgi:hypothetical protein